jgi:hypothetical protein
MGFAHDVIPHSHAHGHDTHHESPLDAGIDHDSEGHSCSGIFCFLQHILSDTEHPSTDGSHDVCDLAEVPQLGKNWLLKGDLSMIQNSELESWFTSLGSPHSPIIPLFDYRSPLLSATTSRGPPC